MNKLKSIIYLGLFSGGFSGGKVIYTVNEGKDKTFSNQVQKTNYSPIPIDLENAINKLRVHAMRLTEIWSRVGDKYYDFGTHEIIISDKDKEGRNEDQITALSEQLHNKLVNCRIVSMNFKANGFKIKFEYRRFDGIFMTYSTELIESDGGYDYYDEVMYILNEIAPIAMDWAEMKLTVDTSRITYGAIMAINNFTDPADAEAVLLELGEDKSLEVAKAHLEKRGHIVISADEAIPNPEEEEEGYTQIPEEVDDEPQMNEPESELSEAEQNQRAETISNDQVVEAEVEVVEADPEEPVIPAIPGAEQG